MGDSSEPDDGPASEAGDPALAATLSPPPGEPAVPAHESVLTVSPPLAARPSPDRLARAVARSRIVDKLFAKKEEVTLGRYHLLEQIGAGGMGVVWGAFDPQLDRRVAIKVVKPELQAARDRLLSEGKALAKLSHPNVVTVYDVGTVDEQIYIVMEWVRGQNLRAHCREPRAIRELLALYRDAGEGLLAAHRAGLIHRDFKPDNAIVGDDGRVRVLDFGLARGEFRADVDSADGDRGSSDLTRGAGTPHYMPPEQAQGKELTPAVDQYAFCVALREALAARTGGKAADVPRWIAEICARGTQREAADRFESMAALLHALARDPATVWRRRLVVAGAVAAAGAAFAVGTLRGGASEIEPCAGDDELGAAWSAQMRDRLGSHLRGLGPYGAQEAERLIGEMSGYRTSWASAQKAACLAQHRGELTPQLYERSLGCFARARAAFETVVDLLATVPADRLPNAVVASQGLPDAARCTTDATISTVDPPPAAIAAPVAALANEVERARVLAVASDPRSAEVAAAAGRRAAGLGYLPLIARAQLVHGIALSEQRATSEAFGALDVATQKAFESGDLPTGIEAYAREVYAIAITAAEQLPKGAAERLGAIPFVESLAKNVSAGGFPRALLYNYLGAQRLAQMDREGARRRFFEARAAREAAGASNVELTWIWGNLAIAATDPAERDQMFERQIAEFESKIGADHPMTLDARLTAATFIENPRRAYERAREPLQRYLALHPHLRSRVSEFGFDIALIEEEIDEVRAARAAMEIVRAAQSADSFEHRFAVGFLLALDGHDERAAAAMTALAEEKQVSDQAWTRLQAVDAWLASAKSNLRTGHTERAQRNLEQALAIFESPSFSEGTYRGRRLARVQAQLAQVLAKSEPTPQRRAKELAAAAARWYRSAGGMDELVAELDAIKAAAGPGSR